MPHRRSLKPLNHNREGSPRRSDPRRETTPRGIKEAAIRDASGPRGGAFSAGREAPAPPAFGREQPLHPRPRQGRPLHPRRLQGGPCNPISGGEAPHPRQRQGSPAPMDRLRSLSVRCGGSRLRKQSAEAPSCSQDGTLPILFRSWSVQVAQDKPVRHDLLMDCPQAPAAGDVGAATGPGIAFPPSRPQTPGNPLINSRFRSWGALWGETFDGDNIGNPDRIRAGCADATRPPGSLWVGFGRRPSGAGCQLAA